MIHSIIDRCHVSASYLSVVRYLLSRMKRGAFRSLPREERRKIIKTAVTRHAENRQLYRAVYAGGL